MVVRGSERVAVAPPEVRPPESWERAAEILQSFLAAVPPGSHHLLLCHNDADGLAAGVLLCRALERAGQSDTRLLPTTKGESAWSQTTLERLGSARPDALFVVDLGSRSRPIYPGVPTLLIDHHRPMGVPPGSVLISSYQWQPNPCTAALAYWLGATLADVGELDWVAAVGIIGDLGQHATLEPLPAAKERYGSRTLREATVLVNAARRSASGDASVALAALLAAREPAEIALGRLPEARQLAEMRQAFNAALAEAKRAAPAFNQRVALIRVQSPYQVHPVLAQIWRGKLPNHIVMVANEGYLPGRVSFSLRTMLDVSLLDFLQAFSHALDATEFGYGHDKATGGSMSTEEWKRLLATMGFR
jgi:single-stranded DNA-specific DHH superfamily exonuclease